MTVVHKANSSTQETWFYDRYIQILHELFMTQTDKCSQIFMQQKQRNYLDQEKYNKIHL